jgi:hypothetical protein
MFNHLIDLIKQDKHKTRIMYGHNVLVKTEYNSTIYIYSSSHMFLQLHNHLCSIQSYQVQFIKRPNLDIAVGEYGLYNTKFPF